MWEAIGAGVLSNYIFGFLKKFRPLLPLLTIPIRFFQIRDLRVQQQRVLNELPFIYRDIDLTVIDSYVDVEHKVLDPKTLEPYGRKSTQTLNDLIRNKNHLVILGAAGMGKTTFQRYTLLTYYRAFKSKQDNPLRNAALIPVFIPLKAIDNSSPYPIYRYLTSEDNVFKLFQGIRGEHNLIHFAKNKKLFLLLDGYDEISEVNSEQNYVKQEIEQILGTTNRETLYSSSNTLYSENNSRHLFYSHVKNCRIWIASRLDFFKLNSFNIINSQNLTSSDPIEFSGVGDKRKALVKAIFDKNKIK